MTAIQFKKAQRHALKLKIGIDGPSGSGKTDGALAIATAITNGGKVAMADSENESGLYYADLYDFDHLPLPDADPQTYRDVIKAAVAQGYDALIIDSLTHAWQQVLQAKDEHEQNNPKANKWTLWSIYGPKWDYLMRDIIEAPIHIIATMRSKQAYEQIEKDGRKSIVKLGMAPQVRDGADYEFGLVFSVNQNHRAEATKDRTNLFEVGQMIDLRSPELHKSLIGWMNQGGEAPIEETTYPIPGAFKGRPLLEVPDAELDAAIKYCRDKDAVKYAKLIKAMVRVRVDRKMPTPGKTGRVDSRTDEQIADENVTKMQASEDKHQAGLESLMAGAG
jgi:hypothetical protein